MDKILPNLRIHLFSLIGSEREEGKWHSKNCVKKIKKENVKISLNPSLIKREFPPLSRPDIALQL